MARDKNDRYELQRKAERKAIFQLVAVLVALVTVFCLSFIFKSPEVDPVTHCPVKAKDQVQRNTILLLDLTDSLPSMRAEQVQTIAQSISTTLKKFERFSIFVLRTNDDFQPIFTQCNPGEPTFMDYLSKGRRELRGQFDKGFSGALEDRLKKELATRQVSERSPIIEGIRTISHSQFWGRENRFYVMSDLLENSTIASLYRKRQSFKSVMQWASAKSVIDSIDLTNTTVGVCPTEYSAAKIAPEVQGNAIQFWKDFFEYSHASCVEIGCHISGAECVQRQISSAKR